jgi:hypothetical protein
MTENSTPSPTAPTAWPFAGLGLDCDFSDTTTTDRLWLEFLELPPVTRLLCFAWALPKKSHAALLWCLFVLKKRDFRSGHVDILSTDTTFSYHRAMQVLLPCSMRSIDRAALELIGSGFIIKGDWYHGHCPREMRLNWPTLAQLFNATKWPQNHLAMSCNLIAENRPQAAILTALHHVYLLHGKLQWVDASGALLVKHCEGDFGASIFPRTINRARKELAQQRLIQFSNQGMQLNFPQVLPLLEAVQTSDPDMVEIY